MACLAILPDAHTNVRKEGLTLSIIHPNMLYVVGDRNQANHIPPHLPASSMSYGPCFVTAHNHIRTEMDHPRNVHTKYGA